MRIEDFENCERKNKSSIDLEKIKPKLENLRTEFEKAMDDDFNTAKALGVIFDFIREINRFMDKKPSNNEEIEFLLRAKETIREIGSILNLFQRQPIDWYRDLLKTKKIPITEEEIERLIKERVEARKIKDWQRADSIRSELLSKGIILEDKPGKTIWKVKIN